MTLSNRMYESTHSNICFNNKTYLEISTFCWHEDQHNMMMIACQWHDGGSFKSAEPLREKNFKVCITCYAPLVLKNHLAMKAPYFLGLILWYLPNKWNGHTIQSHSCWAYPTFEGWHNNSQFTTQWKYFDMSSHQHFQQSNKA